MRDTRFRSPRSRKERGAALLVVLWLAAALAAIALSVSTTVRTETDHASTASEGLRAHYLATGSVERAIQWMRWGPGQRLPDGSPQFWEPNQSRMLMSYPSGDAVVELLPETSKLNINLAPPEDLLRVVQVVSGEPQRAQAIVDGILNWRSGSAGQNQDAYYLSLGPTFEPRHASFEEIEELLFVRGMTPELFYGNYVADAKGQLYARGGLRDCLSVWGSVGAFDVNTMSPALMESIGLPLNTIQMILARRTAQPFKNTGELAALGIPAARLRIGGNSIWTLRATARLRRPDGTPSDVVRSASATLKRWQDIPHQQSPIQVLRFYEDAWSEFALKPPMPGIPGGAVLPGQVPIAGALAPGVFAPGAFGR